MLRALRLENFKSYRQAEMPFGPLTLLLGANASGKSNAIEALRLLSWLAQGNRLGTIQYDVQRSDEIIRGAVRDLFCQGRADFILGCSLEGVKWPDYLIMIGLRDDDLHILHERLSAENKTVPLFEVKQPADPGSSDIRVAYDNSARGGIKPQIVCSDQQAVLVQMQSVARFQTGHNQARKRISEVAGRFQKTLAEIVFLDPQPRAMRGYVHVSEVRLHGDGSNMSAVLADLWRDKERHEEILAFIASLPEQRIKQLDFIDTPRGEVMVRLCETFGGKVMAVDAPLLSDGTLRILAIAASLLSANEGATVVIEEIDNGVHPSRARQLMTSIERVAKERKLNVLLTTHNPALMDALPDTALSDVVFCYRDPEDGASRLVRLSDMPDYPALMGRGPLGELVTQAVVDRFVKTKQDPKENRERAKDWLKQLTANDAA